MRGHFGERDLGDEAEVTRSRCRLVCDETGNVVGRVQVDLLLTNAQRRAPFAKGGDLHPQHSSIKLAGGAISATVRTR